VKVGNKMKPIIFIFCILVLVSPLLGQIPNKISYQGLLTTSSGTPVQDGSYDLKFDIYNLPVGGSLKYTETQTGIPVSKGTFSVLLRPASTIFAESLFVEVTALAGPNISTPVIFSPRSELTSTPYALAPWGTSGSNIFYNSGNVGIGGPDPNKRLTITGDSQNDACIHLDAFWNPEIFFNAGGSAADVKLHFQDRGNDRWNLIYDGSERAINFTHYLNGTTLYLHQLGRVGIGLTDPSEILDVNGTARLRSMGSSTGTTVVVDANGKLWKQTSSRRYKTDIYPLTINIDNVLRLQPVYYRYKETGVDDIGLIAEDVDEVMKDLVIYDNNGQPEAVKYDKLSLYLLEVIKQQQKEINELKHIVKPLTPIK
jgi:hypothetical protein